MTADEVADLMGIHESTVYEWARAGKLPAMRRGRVIRFLRWRIEAWIADDSEPPAVADAGAR
jgi:excisionase family DNA binding protein